VLIGVYRHSDKHAARKIPFIFKSNIFLKLSIS
jgi:hypothetical protein